MIRALVALTYLGFIYGLLGLAPTTATAQSQSSSIRDSIPQSRLQERSWFGNWSLGLATGHLRDEFNQDTFVRSRLQLSIERTYFSRLQLKIQPSLQAHTGHLQNESDAEANRGSVFIREGSANLLWNQEFLDSARPALSLGAIDQSRLHSPLLLDALPFPTLSADLKYLTLQQSVVTSGALTTQTKEFEKTPLFSAAGLQHQFRSGRIKAGGRLQYFAFQDLPQSIATRSGLLGNSTRSVNNVDSDFIYAYRGYSADVNLNLRVTPRTSVELQALAIQNTVAPQGLNGAYSLKAGVGQIFQRVWKVTPSYEFFRVEPDATVASLTSSIYNTNRVGYRAGAEVEHRRYFKMGFFAGQRESIFESPSQRREGFFELRLETKNEPI